MWSEGRQRRLTLRRRSRSRRDLQYTNGQRISLLDESMNDPPLTLFWLSVRGVLLVRTVVRSSIRAVVTAAAVDGYSWLILEVRISSRVGSYRGWIRGRHRTGQLVTPTRWRRCRLSGVNRRSRGDGSVCSRSRGKGGKCEAIRERVANVQGSTKELTLVGWVILPVVHSRLADR
ncbi:hypothetical protein FRC20_008431 [Serendipita sp. 405]|nr:hypothetical protein FRC20_008431 [Serendipita sp. 405]